MLYSIVRVGFPVRGQERVVEDTGLFYAPLLGTEPTVREAIERHTELEKEVLAGWNFELRPVNQGA